MSINIDTPRNSMLKSLNDRFEQIGISTDPRSSEQTDAAIEAAATAVVDWVVDHDYCVPSEEEFITLIFHNAPYVDSEYQARQLADGVRQHPRVADMYHMSSGIQAFGEYMDMRYVFDSVFIPLDRRARACKDLLQVTLPTARRMVNLYRTTKRYFRLENAAHARCYQEV